MGLLQAALGISTLLLVVPMPLALAHQTGALTLLTLALCLAHTVRAHVALAGKMDGATLSMKPAE
jgi:heme A synthase